MVMMIEMAKTITKDIRTAQTKKIISLMDDAALAAMKRSAIQCLAGQLLGVVKKKENEAQEKRLQLLNGFTNQLRNLAIKKGEINKIIEDTPDWGGW